jgi:phasin family protein
MAKTPDLEQMTAAQKANAEVVMALMRTSFEGMQRLAELNMAATREFFNNTVTRANSLLAAKDVNEVAAINQELAKPGLDKAMEYSRNVYDLVAQMQKDMTAVIEAQYSQFTKGAHDAIDKTSKASPVGGDIFGAAMKSMLEQTNKAFEGMNAVARQMAEIADANVKAANAATTKAVSAATKAAKK